MPELCGAAGLNISASFLLARWSEALAANREALPKWQESPLVFAVFTRGCDTLCIPAQLPSHSSSSLILPALPRAKTPSPAIKWIWNEEVAK